MGILEAFNLAQTKVFNVINPLKFFQGVGKPSAKMTKFLPKSRKSWAECYKKEEMMHVYTTTKAGFPTMTWMRSSKYSIPGSEGCGGDPVGNLVFRFLFSAPLDLDLIRHRDSAALFDSRFFGTAPLEPDSIHYRDSAALFNS